MLNRRTILALVSMVLMPLLSYATSLNNPLGTATFCTLIKNLLNAAVIIGIPIAVLFLVLAGLRFVTARGNDDKIIKARDNLFWTVVGIAIFFGAWLITGVIITTLQQINPSLSFGAC